MIEWMKLRTLEPELAVAQFAELRQQVPMLYVLLAVNTAAAAYTHYELAPTWLTVWIPGALISVGILRLVTWHLRPTSNISPDLAIAYLQRTVVLGVAIALAFVAWALMLTHYGGSAEEAHIAIYIAITVIGCIFCLFPLPQAAVSTTVTVTIPYLVYYASLGDPVYAAIAVNILLVTLVMMRVLFNNHRSFAERVRLNGAVTALSLSDHLTGLPNRRHFFAELERRAAAPRDILSCLKLSVGVLDLDRFKAVNDSYGHAAGDELLQQVAKRLLDVFPAEAVMVRLGGDEFAFILDADAAMVKALAEEACSELTRPFVLQVATVALGASCGIAMGREPRSEGSLYDAADYALYASKRDRRGTVTVYSAEHAQRVRDDRQIEAALQAADLERELEVVVQPIVEGAEAGALAVEALARWTSPQLGTVSPAVFIPIAERTGAIHRMTLVLFAKALECAESLPPGVRLSFNLSAHDLASPKTMLSLLTMIRRSSVYPGSLIFELTETSLLHDLEAAETSIAMLRAVGALIALDDFGTGYSSLEYLRRLPIDKVKIDRGFIVDLDKPGGREMLAGIFALCDRMGMACIAEGVEDERQYDALLELGCPSFQGYLFARPMPIDSFLEWNKDKLRQAASVGSRRHERSEEKL
ncbi:bifunctional diguanylate cyclase/phosphodiesterase [Aureimonas sp. AU20]|uniref:putative bifunctional diguanylate cyclase/phosphodiesterase n=1 Tax=Aureimonas sp. AU20 TaxID=1349819 RepID=UPI0007202293|nr:EAL domain-containing protein [Aureimonas sp. AU20]ALN75703.1 hypothetical protein M673_23440 [Aureimonas sp. AU20]